MNTDDGFFEGNLLPEFASTPTEEWHAALAGDLGDDWPQRLRWDADDRVDRTAALDLLPFYRAEDLDDVATGTPGARPGWQLRHDLTDPEDAVREARAALDGGAEALGLPPALAASPDALDAVLAEVGDAALHLEGTPAQARRVFGKTGRGSLTFDPAARRLQSESFDAKDGYEQLAVLVQEDVPPGVRLVTADARPFHEAGTGASLGLALAAMSEHFARLTEHGVPAPAVAQHAQVVLPVGTRFFVEVARLRAMRRLFAQLAEAYDVAEPPRLRVQAATAWPSVTLYDPHLNLLRGATAGAAAAILGGADVLAVRPFDAAHDEPSDFGRRLSLNAQHILREEAHLGRVADPAAGSYYAEVLTDRLARRAWAHFQEIEADGGLLAALHRGDVQKHLTEARADRQEALAQRRRVRVGTNHFPNLDETRLDVAPDRDAPPRETDAFERLRLATERHAQKHGTERPAAFLLPVGTPKVRSARANFARNVLGCAGFRALESTGFDSAEEGARAAAEAVERGEAQLVACCAPDADYAALLPALREALESGDVPLIVAGRPAALSEERQQHVDAFFHRGMNVLETLEALQKPLGTDTIANPKSQIANRNAS